MKLSTISLALAFTFLPLISSADCGQARGRVQEGTEAELREQG